MELGRPAQDLQLGAQFLDSLKQRVALFSEASQKQETVSEDSGLVQVEGFG